MDSHPQASYSGGEWTSPSGPVSPFLALCGVGFLGRLSYEMIRTPITPLFAKHLGAPTDLIGLIVAAVTITGIAVKLPSGALSDLFGFRRLMMAGALVKATGPFLYLAVLAWPVLLLVRFYHGLATALYAPPASALVAKAYPEERGHRLGLYSASESGGVVIGPVLGGVVLAVSSFHAAFIVSGVIGLLALAAMRKVPRDELTSAPPAPVSGEKPKLTSSLRELGRGVHQIVSDPVIRLVSLVEAMLWLGIGSLQAYLPLYALMIHLPTWQIGLLAGGQGVASILSRPYLGRRSDRIGRKPLIVVGALLCIGTLIAIPYSASFPVLLVLSVVFGLGTGMVTPSTTAMIGDLVTRGNYGSAMGVFGSLWDAGHAGGPIIFGFLVVALGYRTSWLLMALVMAVAVIVFVFGTAKHGATTQ